MTKLNDIYDQIEQLSDEIPKDQARKITLYSQALLLIGRYHAQAVRDHGRCYAERKRKWGVTIMDTPGTIKDKEAAAEAACYDQRMAEADAEMEMWKWKNLYNSTVELINAVKIEQRTLMVEYNNGGQGS